MKDNSRKKQRFLWIRRIIILTACIFMLPIIVGVIVENNTTNRVLVHKAEGLPFQKRNETKTVRLEEKVAYVADKSVTFVALKLQTGYLFSLYEARVSSYSELKKIEYLKINETNLSKDAITMSPYLFMDKRDPSKGFFAWKGTILVDGRGYEFWLDEESEKIVRIEMIIGNAVNNVFEGEKQKLRESWKKYIKDFI